MDNSREAIKKALADLVARKDATIFQSLDNFEQALRKIGNWPSLPEITALKAGLQQRLPWELQKAAAGNVPAKTVANLANLLGQNHRIEATLALWTVTTWAAALNLKCEQPESAVAGDPVVTAAPPAAVKSSSGSDFAGSSLPSARTGVIFGLAEDGQIRVFQSWARPASAAECSGMAYTPVKREERNTVRFFSAAPKNQRPTPKVAEVKPAAVVALPTRHTGPALPLPTAPTPRPPVTEPLRSPAPSARPVASPTPDSAVSATPRVYNGTAEELFQQGQALMPGHSNRVNMTEAMQLLSRSASMGYTPARRVIGEIYLKGLGVKSDCQIAAGWFRQAAEAGDAQAQFQLGSLYQCGMGVEFNLPMAQEWLTRAASQGHAEARELLQQILQA